MACIREPRNIIFRVGDGYNLRNSRYDFWGVKDNTTIRGILENNLEAGDKIWFVQSKTCKLLGVATYTKTYNRTDEPLIDIHTISAEEQGWRGDTKWDIRIHYDCFYDIEHLDLEFRYHCASPILFYEGYLAQMERKEKEAIDLDREYSMINRYMKPNPPSKF